MTAALLLATAACGGNDSAPAERSAPAEVPEGRPSVIAETPHDPAAYTQGFEVDGDVLYESTGQFGQSQLREIDPATGAVLRSTPLPADFFGEGLAVVGDKIWQLTWKNGVAIEWDKNTFTQIRQAPMNGEGWGLCYDGERLLRSDGSAKLHIHDPASFDETGTIDVKYKDMPFPRLNELECKDGQVWANVYQTDQIARIDPATGQVTAVIDAAGLLDPARRSKADVLNGIADLGNGEFLVTGKNWPAMFRVRLDVP